MKFQRIGPTGLLRVGTMMTIGGMTNGRRAVMVNGEFRRHGGMMVLDGIATGMDIYATGTSPKCGTECKSRQ